MLPGCRIELWVEERDSRPAVNPVMAELMAGLTDAGARVRARVIERQAVDPAHPARADLVLLRSATDLALASADAAGAAGVRVVEAPGPTRRAVDKAAVVGLLAANDLPVPATYLIGGAARPEAAEDPGAWARRNWVRKPVRGLHGSGVSNHGRLFEAVKATDRTPVAAWITDDGCRLAQAAVGDGPDLKVYAAGDRLFAGRKWFQPRSYMADAIERVELDRATAELVRTVGRVLGLRVYGVDLRLERGRPCIIDVNPFPGFRGFPEAAAVLQREVVRILTAA